MPGQIPGRELYAEDIFVSWHFGFPNILGSGALLDAGKNSAARPDSVIAMPVLFAVSFFFFFFFLSLVILSAQAQRLVVGHSAITPSQAILYVIKEAGIAAKYH